MEPQIEKPDVIDPADLVTVASLAAEAPAFNEQKLRWLIFHAETNGLSPALVRVNNRVYIHRPTFGRWLAAGQKRGAR